MWTLPVNKFVHFHLLLRKIIVCTPTVAFSTQMRMPFYACSGSGIAKSGVHTDLRQPLQKFGINQCNHSHIIVISPIGLSKKRGLCAFSRIFRKLPHTCPHTHTHTHTMYSILVTYVEDGLRTQTPRKHENIFFTTKIISQCY